MNAFLLYLYYTVLDGDYANDYLTHMPHIAREYAYIIGKIIADILP